MGAVLALGLTVAGCASPTLPLPPPESPTVGAIDGDGFVELKGSAQPDAVVYAFNQRSEEGVIGKSSSYGTYVLRLKAQVGDEITLWQEVGSERSVPALVVVKKLRASGLPGVAPGGGWRGRGRRGAGPGAPGQGNLTGGGNSQTKSWLLEQLLSFHSPSDQRISTQSSLPPELLGSPERQGGPMTRGSPLDQPKEPSVVLSLKPIQRGLVGSKRPEGITLLRTKSNSAWEAMEARWPPPRTQ